MTKKHYSELPYTEKKAGEEVENMEAKNYGRNEGNKIKKKEKGGAFPAFPY